MPFKVVEPPDAVRDAAASHVHQLATPRGVFPALRDVVREELELVAPHRMYTLGLDALLERGIQGATESGWRYLVMDRERVVASAELGAEQDAAPLINAGPYVGSTATAIDELEQLPEVARGEDVEMRLLKVPGLYVVAAWLSGDRPIVVPLAPAPSFLEAGHPYSEEEFASALREPARVVLAAEGASGG